MYCFFYLAFLHLLSKTIIPTFGFLSNLLSSGVNGFQRKQKRQYWSKFENVCLIFYRPCPSNCWERPPFTGIKIHLSLPNYSIFGGILLTIITEKLGGNYTPWFKGCALCVLNSPVKLGTLRKSRFEPDLSGIFQLALCCVIEYLFWLCLFYITEEAFIQHW